MWLFDESSKAKGSGKEGEEKGKKMKNPEFIAESAKIIGMFHLKRALLCGLMR